MNKKEWTVIVTAKMALFCEVVIHFLRLPILNTGPLFHLFIFDKIHQPRGAFDTVGVAFKHSQFSTENSMALRNTLYQFHEETGLNKS
jgi:hypothetical protein